MLKRGSEPDLTHRFLELLLRSSASVQLDRALETTDSALVHLGIGSLAEPPPPLNAGVVDHHEIPEIDTCLAALEYARTSLSSVGLQTCTRRVEALWRNRSNSLRLERSHLRSHQGRRCNSGCGPLVSETALSVELLVVSETALSVEVLLVSETDLSVELLVVSETALSVELLLISETALSVELLLVSKTALSVELLLVSNFGIHDVTLHVACTSKTL